MSATHELSFIAFLEDYHELHKYSITDWGFWKDIWEFLSIIYSAPPEKVSIRLELPKSYLTSEVSLWYQAE